MDDFTNDDARHDAGQEPQPEPQPEPAAPAPNSAAALYNLAPAAAQPQTPTTGEEDGDAPQA